MYTNLVRFFSLLYLAKAYDNSDNIIENGNTNNTFVLRAISGMGAYCEYNPCNQALDPIEKQWIYYPNAESAMMLSYDICASSGEGAVLYEHDKASCAIPTGESFNVTAMPNNITVTGSSNVEMKISKVAEPETDEDKTLLVNRIEAVLSNSVAKNFSTLFGNAKKLAAQNFEKSSFDSSIKLNRV